MNLTEHLSYNKCCKDKLYEEENGFRKGHSYSYIS